MTMGDEPATPGDGATEDLGFGTAEKALGAWAAYEHPLVAGLTANALSHSESNPTRRRQLVLLSRAAFAWWAIGVAVAIVAVIAFFSFTGHGVGSSECPGEPNKLDPMNTTYRSADGEHWTAIYPCVGGGTTAIPVPAANVPGEGS